MKRILKWAAGTVVVLVVAALAVPFLVPVSSFIPQVEGAAARALGQPVSVADMRLHLHPTPRIVATGLRVGAKGEVTIGELEVVPDLMSFLGDEPALRLVRAQRVDIQEAALALLGAVPRGAGAASGPMDLRRVEVRQVKLHHAKVALPELDMAADLLPGLRLQHLRLETRDGTLKGTASPAREGGLSIAATAANWTLPAGAPLAFDALSVEGVVRDRTLDAKRIQGRLYGGSLEGHASLSWSQGWEISGKATVAGVELGPLQKALGRPAKLTGRLNAQASVAMRARTPAQLADALALDGPFEVLDGVYQGVDLEKTGVLAGAPAEGTTPFKEFRGVLQVRGRATRISELCLRSPSVVAGGTVAVDADERLSGRLDVSVARTGGIVGVPLQLRGSASDPALRPAKGYMVGAAIGTAILPGIGTAIGSSLGARMSAEAGCR